MNDRIDRGRPTYLRLEVAPPPGVAQCRASCWCGTRRHPRSVAVTRREAELREALRAYRCAVCGKGNL